MHQAFLLVGDIVFSRDSEEMPPKSRQCGQRVGNVVADGLECQCRIGERIDGVDPLIAPQAQTVFGETRPGKLQARINLAAWRDIAMAENVLHRNAMAHAQFVKQRNQAGDLRFLIGLIASVVELDANRCRVEIGQAAPVGLAGMPGTARLIDQLVDRAVTADQVMRTDLACRVGQGSEWSRDVVAGGVVENDEIRSPFAVVRRWILNHLIAMSLGHAAATRQKYA